MSQTTNKRCERSFDHELLRHLKWYQILTNHIPRTFVNTTDTVLITGDVRDLESTIVYLQLETSGIRERHSEQGRRARVTNHQG